MKTFDVLPPDCVIPPGVGWCGMCGDDTPWFSVYDKRQMEIWAGLNKEERAFIAARCAMWWEAEWYRLMCIDDSPDRMTARATELAWIRLWRELEGME